MKYDYLVVGAGLYGATFARQATDRGKNCLVIDKRPHIGGNTYTKKIEGIDVHMYGPHIFHTNSPVIWDFVNQFAEFNDYRHKVLSCHSDRLYSFPLNLKTLEQLWGKLGEKELLAKFESGRSEHQIWENLEEWAIAEVGEEIYYKFIYGYTKKQWGTPPANLDSSIISRIPVRTDRNDDYHQCKFSGIPTCGYTEMVANMLYQIPTALGEDYLLNREHWDKMAKRIVYTGPIDEFFNCEHGELPWRSLRFEQKRHDCSYVQPVAQINYAEERIPYTRSVEHKHFNDTGTPRTILTIEYPEKYKKGKEKYYPIKNSLTDALYNKYKKMIPDSHIFGGRLAEYRYYDMDQVIGAAIAKFRRIL